MNIKRQEAGRIGGISTLMKYGTDHFSRNGQKGGRPRLKTLDDLGRQTVLEAKGNNRKGGKLPNLFLASKTNSLTELKELYELQNKNGGS